MGTKRLTSNPHEAASIERARAEWPNYWYSHPRDGVVSVWNPDTDTECDCDKTGGSCQSARHFSPRCKHYWAIHFRHKAKRAADRAAGRAAAAHG